ncbi:MAG: AAA family ATPase [Thermaerobacter sp.]|nr:AAA family ATPase [Thermaerobacter sp.]
MLRLLQLRELAIVDEIELEFAEGLTVITGETGAGKSILLDGLDLALGARASRQIVRQGAESARVVAVFWPPDGGETVLEREVSEGGRSLSRIDGRAASLAEVRATGDGLVELLAQGEAATLLRPQRQRQLLDRFCGAVAVYEQASALSRHIVDLRTQREELGGDPRQRERQVDLLRHQVEEIDAAQVKDGEFDSIEQQIDLLGKQEDILSALSDAHSLLRGDDSQGAEEMLAQAVSRLRPFARLHEEIARLVSVLEEGATLLAESVSTAAGLSDTLEFDPSALRRAEERRALLVALKRKYGDAEAEILAFRAEAAAELERLASWEEEAARIGAEITDAEAQLADLVRALYAQRLDGAKALEQAVAPELERLSLQDAALRVAVQEGLLEDAVRFDFSPNPGEPTRPLAQIASGGEASRVLLAISSVLARDERATLVCDEVDQGLGGRAARSLAEHLRSMAEHRQVIAVSHQAVVAARAHRHIGLRKEVLGGRTIVRAYVLQGEERVREIARMLSGESGELALKHAAQLLEEA